MPGVNWSMLSSFIDQQKASRDVAMTMISPTSQKSMRQLQGSASVDQLTSPVSNQNKDGEREKEAG